MLKPGITFFIIFLFAFSQGRANLRDELNKFCDELESYAQINSAEVYQGQKAGYATGGGASVRNRVMNTKPITVDLPKFEAGCGGIDIYAGGMSFIDSADLVQNLKSIASNAAGFAFFLSLESVSPQASNNIKQLQSWANMINGTSINSCESASQLVGAVWPQKTAAHEQICRLVGVNGLGFSDYINARHKCSSSDEKKGELAKAKEIGFLVGEYNLGWEAIKQDPEFAANKELAEIMMTLMGTIITSDGEETNKGTFYPSRITDESFLKIFLEGGTTRLYKCEDDQCLIVTEELVTITAGESWIGKAKQHLINIQDKIYKDEELDAAEINFITKSSLPLYKIVNVLSAYKQGYCPLDLFQVSEIVALDMLSQYLRDSIDRVREGCQRLKWTQLYASDVDDYLAQLDRVERKINDYETRTMARKQKEAQIIEKIEAFEKYLFSQYVLY